MMETHLAEVKHQGELKLQQPRPPSHGRLLYLMRYWKNRWTMAHYHPARPPLCRPARLLPAGLPGRCPIRPSPRGPTGPLHTRWPTGPPGLTPQALQAATNLPASWHTSHHPPQEGSNTTRHQLQTCLWDADKQDWMLKE
jgi:hypothetical protein